MTQAEEMKPFLRWAGGKRKLTPLIISHIPKNFDPTKSHFYEPFTGGGALMLALGNRESTLYVPGEKLHINDINSDLVAAYKAIKSRPRLLMEELDKLAVKKDHQEFLEIRASRPSGALQKAARFIYLNKTCFNGLWRVNSNGDFNVPFGKLKNPTIYDFENIMNISRRLNKAEILNGHFAACTKSARKGDLIYFDPPYIPLNQTSSFSHYAKDGFGIEEHEALAVEIKRLSKLGARVILSNSDTKLTHEIYGSVIKLHRIKAPRTISAKASSRGEVSEVLGLNY